MNWLTEDRENSRPDAISTMQPTARPTNGYWLFQSRRPTPIAASGSVSSESRVWSWIIPCWRWIWMRSERGGTDLWSAGKFLCGQSVQSPPSSRVFIRCFCPVYQFAKTTTVGWPYGSARFVGVPWKHHSLGRACMESRGRGGRFWDAHPQFIPHKLIVLLSNLSKAPARYWKFLVETCATLLSLLPAHRFSMAVSPGAIS